MENKYMVAIAQNLKELMGEMTVSELSKYVRFLLNRDSRSLSLL